MTLYGEDANPDFNLASEIAYFQNFLPHDDDFVTQWTYDGGRVVRQVSNKRDKSKCLFKIQE